MQFLGKRIYVSGHNGMVGSAVTRKLTELGSQSLLLRSSYELDLTRQSAVEDFFRESRPQVVVFGAGRVGGIHANNEFPADFIRDNLLMASHCIDAAFQFGVERFLYLGSTCIYPRDAVQPIREDSLLTAELEKTNEAYALAKIAGLKMCQFYRRQHKVLFHSAMPTNLYGPGDNYHPLNSHVLPALIRRVHQAKINREDSVEVWGTGRPRREFLHVDDLAAAIVFLLQLENPPDWVNVGTGTDISIGELAQLVADTIGFTGKITYDVSKPDGTLIKRTDTTLMRRLGWKAEITLEEGLRETYRSFVSELESNTIRQ